MTSFSTTYPGWDKLFTMEIIGHPGTYDLGHFIYDLWTIIVVAGLCIMLSFLCLRGFMPTSTHKKKDPYTLNLLLITCLALLLLNLSSFWGIAFSILGFFGLFWIRKQKLPYYVLLLCASLVGLGYNLLPISLAFLWFVSVYFYKKPNKTHEIKYP